MENLLVSICIPAYNQTVFLKKTLESIGIQSYRNFEVIVTDDSDTNEVRDLCEAFTGRFAIGYHKNARPLGSPANWNSALDLARGSLIKIMHHDDWFAAPDSLGEFVRPFEQDLTLEMVFCRSEILNVAENRTSFNIATPSFLQGLALDQRILFNNNLIGAPSATMFRNTPARFDEKLKYLVDIEFYSRILINRRFVYIDKPLIVNTAGHAGQVTASSMNKQIQVGEFSYVYDKFFGSKIPSFKLNRFFVNLFLHYKLRSLNEIRTWGFSVPRPEWWFGVLLGLSKVKRSVRLLTGKKETS